VFGVLAGGFAIFAGFIIFLAFTTYDQSRSGAETEAITVVQQVESAELFPPAVRHRLTGQLVCYGRSVVHQEWPQMVAGKGGDTINPWGAALFQTLRVADPKTAIEQTAYGKYLDQRCGPRERQERSAPRRRGHHPDVDLARPDPDRGRRLRLHAVLRRQRGGPRSPRRC
jgi:hypothetical protein